MLKSILFTASLLTGTGFGCTIMSWKTLYYEYPGPGVVNVSVNYGSYSAPSEPPSSSNPYGTFYLADFKAAFQGQLRDSSIVFIASIDSMIGSGFKDTVVPDLVPAFTLAGSPNTPGLYLRFKVDTVFKGAIPSGSFWVRSYPSFTVCDPGGPWYKGFRFLNVSNKFDNISDLKLRYEAGCTNCPRASTFDGRFLTSPDFPGLRMDITDVMPTYPATGILRSRAPWKTSVQSGKVYQPDGRRVPDAGKSPKRKASVPLLR